MKNPLKERSKRFFILFAALFLVITPLAGVLASSLSPEEERELGERFLKSINSQYEFADFPYITQYINDLGAYLGRQIEVPYFPLKFYVVKDNIVNAFAGPGGHVFIFSGLIISMEDMDELASVLAHELAHVSARHLASRIERSQKISIATIAGVLTGILVGGKASGALVTGSLAAGVQTELGYSREDERQADQLGFKYAHLSGFNPSGMLSVLKKMARENWYQTGETPQYLLTHPGASERTASIEAMLEGYKKLPDSERAKELRSNFAMFHTMVIACCHDKDNAARVFEKKLLSDPESPLDHYGLGLVLEREGNIHEALNHFKKAFQKKPDSIPIMFSIGKAYQAEGQHEDSVSILKKALELAPQDKKILYLMALSLQELERYDESSKIYERLSFLPPVKDTVYYNLGLVYGRQGNIALAHYNLGIYFTKLNDREKALFHFNKAKELAETRPALKEKIEKALTDLGRFQKQGQ
ncbi:MAG TPA: M48 family metalloprotease [Desulfatiglandales bacterium]|nr:M48 family metalloprotease [Desulfatiglandales bacterium]